MRRVHLIGLALLAAHIALGSAAAVRLAQTYDEAVHLSSGYSFWKSGRYRVDAELNTPLPRLLAALPLLISDPDPFLEDPSYLEGRDFSYADKFLYHNRVPMETLLHSSRIFLLVVLGILLGAVSFRWAREIAGEQAGLWSLFFCLFNPVLLANSHLITADYTAAVIIFLCLYALSRGAFLTTGILLGLALGSKHSAVLLAGILPASYGLFAFMKGRSPTLKTLGKGALLLGLGAAVGLIVVYRPHQISLWGQGVMKLIGLSMGDAARRAYLFGEVAPGGWWYYFPAAFLLKSPLPLLILLALVPYALTLRGMTEDSKARIYAFLLLPPALWILAASASNFQVGIRHILPVFPFLTVLAGIVFSRIWSGGKFWEKAAMGFLALWYAFGTLKIHPNYLAYFNEAAGGPENGYKSLAGSNLDWGQGLKELGEYLEEEGSPAVFLSYFGTADPRHYGIRYMPLSLNPDMPRVYPRTLRFDPRHLFFAISATNRVCAFCDEPSRWAWLDAYDPVRVIGHSIFVFDFSRRPEALYRLAEVLEGQGNIAEAGVVRRWAEVP